MTDKTALMVSISAGLCMVLSLWVAAMVLLYEPCRSCGGNVSEESELLHRECHPAEDLDLRDHVFSRLMAFIARAEEGDALEIDLSDAEMGILIAVGHAHYPKEYR